MIIKTPPRLAQHSGQHSGPRGGMLAVLSQHTHPAVLASWLLQELLHQLQAAVKPAGGAELNAASHRMFTATMRVSAHQTVADGDYRLARDPLHDDCFRDTPVLADTPRRLLPGQERRPFGAASRAGHRIAHQTAADGDDRLARDPLHDDCCRYKPGSADTRHLLGQERRPIGAASRAAHRIASAHRTVVDGDDELIWTSLQEHWIH